MIFTKVYSFVVVITLRITFIWYLYMVPPFCRQIPLISHPVDLQNQHVSCFFVQTLSSPTQFRPYVPFIFYLSYIKSALYLSFIYPNNTPWLPTVRQTMTLLYHLYFCLPPQFFLVLHYIFIFRTYTLITLVCHLISIFILIFLPKFLSSVLVC